MSIASDALTHVSEARLAAASRNATIAVRELNATADLASQRDQLCRSAAFSASSRLVVDLNGEANSLRRKHSSAIIVA